MPVATALKPAIGEAQGITVGETRPAPRNKAYVGGRRSPYELVPSSERPIADAGGRLLTDDEIRRRKRLKGMVGKFTIRTVFFSNFIVYTALSMLSPFFPMYAESKFQASSLTIGFIFAAHP